VLLSSHLMSEMSQTADRLVVLGKGRVIADASVADVLAGSGGGTVAVRTDEADRLEAVLRPLGGTVTHLSPDRLEVSGLTAEQVARTAAPAGVLLLELTPVQTSLEDAFFGLTDDAVEYRSGSRTQA
jgi:ABC-2 type transport system ATP-binding protein